MNKILLTFLIIFCFTSCSSLIKYQKTQEDFKNTEFEKKVFIVESEEPKTVSATTTVTPPTNLSDEGVTLQNQTTIVKTSPKKNTIKKKLKTFKTVVEPVKRQPEIEDSEGFNNRRRPELDPFRVGETVTHEVTYLGATAGSLVLKVNPFAIVNGRKSYNFMINLKSTSFFSRVFAVDDKVQTFVDFESLVPHVFKMEIRDSVQVKEAQSYFDNETLKADYWEHRYTEKNGHEEKKLNWTILPFSQNPFSAIFYMRIFNFTVGKEYAFRVADDEKNVSFKAKALEKTLLKTEAGEFKAIKVKAEVYSRGNLAKASDFYIWMSDDDRKYILRIEVKLQFGSVVSEVVQINQGRL